MGMSLALPMSEFLYGAVCIYTNRKEDAYEGWVAERSSKEIFVAVRCGQKRRCEDGGICFRKCRCGSQATPYEIISIFRRGWGVG